MKQRDEKVRETQGEGVQDVWREKRGGERGMVGNRSIRASVRPVGTAGAVGNHRQNKYLNTVEIPPMDYGQICLKRLGLYISVILSGPSMTAIQCSADSAVSSRTPRGALGFYNRTMSRTRTFTLTNWARE